MAEICPTIRDEKILLATDGSEYSEGAVREAIRLAKKCSGRLSAISVVEANPEFETLAPQIVENREKAARQNLDAVQTRARQEGVVCDTIIHEGEESYKYIVDEALKNKSTMIVMGRRGRTGLKRLVMGSVTARVIGHSHCNVLVVPKTAQLEFRSIVVATDGSKYSEAAASDAIGLAKRNGSALTVISVVPSELMTSMDLDFIINPGKIVEEEMHNAENHAKAVKEAAQKEGVVAKAFVVSGKPADAIIKTAKETNADLIVVGSHGRTGLEKLLMGSVAERVIILAPCAVLVVKGA